jgi:hypothetical protein
MRVDGARRKRLRARNLDAWCFMMDSFVKRMKAAALLDLVSKPINNFNYLL